MKALFLLLVLAAPLALVDEAAAKRRLPPVRVECSSLKDRHAYCRTHAIGRVRLEQQLSKAACREHRTWGADGDGSGVWVRDGCRGVFVVERGSWSGGSRPKPRTVTCTSRDYGYQHCAVPTWGHDVRLERQISRQRCVRGDTWGVDWRGIWVDRGCNGEFLVE
jgi:hypothetical protein